MENLNSLRVFLALIQTKSTKRAAVRLGRSQSHVSKVLAQLREELDDPLFVRCAEGLLPTAYSLSIEPKLQAALEQLNQALHPEEFDPKVLDKVTLHIVEPYLVNVGYDIIKALRKETDAHIEMRSWSRISEALIAEGEVDLGVHIYADRPQSFYQKKLHSGGGYFEGNTEGEYVKFLIPGVNDTTHHFHELDPSITPGIFVDNYQLMEQLMKDCYTVRFTPHKKRTDLTKLNIEVSLIIKSSKRNSPKTEWLIGVVEPIINGLADGWKNNN